MPPGTPPATLTLDVGPRNPKRLQEVCARLAVAASSPETGLALGPAETLSYVLDLVAVPYLVTVADGGTRSIAVDGLARIAQREGLDAVLRQIGPHDAALRAAVRQGLYNLQHNVRAVD
ncbi:MAG: hypothetical protein ACRD11_02940 [Terriglobia bacterium]